LLFSDEVDKAMSIEIAQKIEAYGMDNAVSFLLYGL